MYPSDVMFALQVMCALRASGAHRIIPTEGSGIVSERKRRNIISCRMQQHHFLLYHQYRKEYTPLQTARKCGFAESILLRGL